ncbi:hypothetical protein EPUS_01799 [Endocarpon pusillum Z07020]|uniref:Clathrin light chain n=1 Tax=Endocarpon pusillum (strain Z07020 / HMAS-L-300199) TaxID=1263415 RepID=U1HRV4_ENDPU|nr:uncharacterized protein EPUS_01799 [Endocarpon pusillum Z07020]ERF71884.1 hypothetical protein EPUS_01799 [Endocarpon pusillum Z07020]
MADRFPSIDDLDLGDNPPSTAPAEGSFLDRERAALGEDADQFATEQDRTTTSATVQDGEDDLLGENVSFREIQPEAATTQEDLEFENSYPAIDTQNQAVAPDGKITGGSGILETSGYKNYTPFSNEEESEPIRKWRERREADISRRDAASAARKEEIIAKARRDIDDFYESYNRKTDKQKAETARQAAEFIKNREDTTAGGTSWERIAKLADLSGKGQGGGGEGSTKKRMRELLLELKNDPNAPGAGGA